MHQCPKQGQNYMTTEEAAPDAGTQDWKVNNDERQDQSDALMPNIQPDFSYLVRCEDKLETA